MPPRHSQTHRRFLNFIFSQRHADQMVGRGGARARASASCWWLVLPPTAHVARPCSCFHMAPARQWAGSVAVALIMLLGALNLDASAPSILPSGSSIALYVVAACKVSLRKLPPRDTRRVET